ncbi:MAG: signal transduction histidine kinase [Paracoccaceae bacterium]|jgi:signal transduction histidine kinase
MRSLVERELALVSRAADINNSLSQVVAVTNHIALGAFGASLLITIVLALDIVSFTRRSISILHRGTEPWCGGRLDYEVPPLHGELGQLAESFSHMARNLRTAMNEVRAARADAARQAKSSFLVNMSHELRTPMNAIIGYSEMMIEEAVDDGSMSVAEFLPDLEKVLSSGQHLFALIDDVLDISKIESGKMTVYNEDVDIDRLMGAVLVTVQPIADKNRTKLVYANSLRDQRTATDVTRFRQVCLNLLSNAAKFTNDGVVNVGVRDVRDNGRDFIEVAVRDTGIGLLSEQLELIFEAFIPADLSTTKEYGGTGLGLMISRKFSQLLGGDIFVESEGSRGSCFVFRLPRLEVSLPKSVGRLAAESAHNPNALVLVVDDNEAAREISLRLLHQAGFEVVVASSGAEAIEVAIRRM